MRQVLGWIVCAKRPLRWREIQGAICVDLEQQNVNFERKLLDSPRGLFAALVEIQTDGSVELVHSTARQYVQNRLYPKEMLINHLPGISWTRT